MELPGRYLGIKKTKIGADRGLLILSLQYDWNLSTNPIASKLPDIRHTRDERSNDDPTPKRKDSMLCMVLTQKSQVWRGFSGMLLLCGTRCGVGFL